MEKFLDKFIWVINLLQSLRIIEIKILVDEVTYTKTVQRILENMDWSE